MSPGIGLMDRRLKTEKDAISLATSGILKQYKTESTKIETLETKYDDDAVKIALDFAKNNQKCVLLNLICQNQNYFVPQMNKNYLLHQNQLFL